MSAAAAVRACRQAREDLVVRREEAGRTVQACRQARAHHPTPNALPPLDAEQVALIQEHLSLAAALAQRYAHRGESVDDLRQVALAALVGSARRWDPARSVPFAGFATPSVLGELKRHFRDRAWSMRVPRSTQDRYRRVVTERDSYMQEHGRVPTPAQIAERLGCDVDGVLDAMEAGDNFKAASLDDPFGPAATGMPTADGGYEGVIQRRDLALAIEAFDEETRYVLRRRFVDEWSQRRIADDLGVSQMHVSRLLARVLRYLRSRLQD